MWNLVLNDLTSSSFFRTTVEIKVIDNLELLQFFPFKKKKKKTFDRHLCKVGFNIFFS